MSAAAQYLRLKEGAGSVVNHFAAKYTTDERLEPVADTEDRLKIRGLGRPQPLDTAAECKRLRCGPLSSDDSRFAPGGMSGVLSRSTQPCDSTQTSGGPPPPVASEDHGYVFSANSNAACTMVFEPRRCSCRRGNLTRVLPESASASA